MARGGEVVGAPPSRYGVAVFCGRPDLVRKGVLGLPRSSTLALTIKGIGPRSTNFVIPHAREAQRHGRE